ncbi:MAG: class I SAM-dependent RNA methyltransferase [Acetatifactor sp.]|nr:class I SAM-dependent RNA methyltransferase [Acetatifactor sp.]
MKKGQVYEGIVERVDFPNKGVVRAGEETVIVKNSLPGQKIKLSVNKVRKGKAEGRLLEVMEQSPLETGSPCSRFGVCGGCTYLSLPYEEQLRIKEAQVKKLLDSVLSGQEQSWIWEGIKGSPKAYEYRNKMEFSFGDEYKDGPLALGMHKRGSFYDVVNVEDCAIVDADYRLILKTVREYFAERRVSYFHRLRHEGYLRHLLVRKASKTGEILVALVTTSQSPWRNGEDDDRKEQEPERQAGQECRDRGLLCEEKMVQSVESVKQDAEIAIQKAETELIEDFRKLLLSLEQEGRLQGRFAGILHIVNDSRADVVRSDRTDVLYGKEYFYEELLGLRFKISTFSFFQTNSYSAEVLYETAREYVGELGSGRPDGKPDKTVFDLYSGTGTIAQMMASAAERVVGVEIVEEAVEAAGRNAMENGISNCEFIAGDVLKVLDELEEKPDLIILDPPRDGIHPKALPKIISYGVERIVYISCKPTSLVRDLEMFRQRGYVVEKAVAVDQFPWTANVETVCLLSNRKSKPDTHVKLSLSMEDYYRIKEEGKNNQ